MRLERIAALLLSFFFVANLRAQCTTQQSPTNTSGTVAVAIGTG
jgi:hypothetical protein